MSEEMIIRHCSPTLAGMKTGSIFIWAYESEHELKESVRKWNKLFSRKGIRVYPLRCRSGKALIYIYRPSQLNADLSDSVARSLLSERGYDPDAPCRCLRKLMRRIQSGDEFPHEIGLFLGYPPKDVHGFIENRADSCKCVGLWKVYSDEEAAKKLFAKYRKCTDVYCAQHAMGRSIDRLTLPSRIGFA